MVPYRLYLDQPTLALDRPFYVGRTWELIRDTYTQHVKMLFLKYAQVSGVSLNSTVLDKDVSYIVQFEYTIANTLMTDEKTRRNFA